MKGYLLDSPDGRRIAAHANGSVSIMTGVDTVLLSPDDVETLREVLRLAGALHSRARRKAVAAQYDAQYEEGL